MKLAAKVATIYLIVAVLSGGTTALVCSVAPTPHDICNYIQRASMFPVFDVLGPAILFVVMQSSHSDLSLGFRLLGLCWLLNSGLVFILTLVASRIVSRFRNDGTRDGRLH